MQDDQNAPTPATQHSEYEAPQVERVMDAEELTREVHYAGVGGGGVGVIPVSP